MLLFSQKHSRSSDTKHRAKIEAKNVPQHEVELKKIQANYRLVFALLQTSLKYFLFHFSLSSKPHYLAYFCMPRILRHIHHQRVYDILALGEHNAVVWISFLFMGRLCVLGDASKIINNDLNCVLPNCWAGETLQKSLARNIHKFTFSQLRKTA